MGRWFRDELLRRVFKNAGLLLSAQGLAGLCSFGFIALSARALGPELFGVLVLIQTYVQTVAGVTKFQSWQALIHYGAHHCEAGRRGALQGLIKFTMSLDLASSAVGTVIAVSLVAVIGPWLGWSGPEQTWAQIYSLLILFSISATPTGILRLYDRFDLLAWQSLIMPASRLAGVTVAYGLGAPFWVYLAIWFVTGVLDRLSLFALGWRELARQGLIAGMGLSLRGVVSSHPGLWRFVWSTNLDTSLGQVMRRIDTLVVGWMLGPAAAGLYRIAKNFAKGLAAPVVQLRQTIYPELAKLLAQRDGAAVRRVMLRSGLIAGAVVTGLVLVVAAVGEPVLRFFLGAPYVAAYQVMVLLVVARSLSVFTFALGPALTAMGAPGVLLRINVCTALAFLPILVLLLDWLGLNGAGFATLAVALPSTVALILITLRRLDRVDSAG